MKQKILFFLFQLTASLSLTILILVSGNESINAAKKIQHLEEANLALQTLLAKNITHDSSAQNSSLDSPALKNACIYEGGSTFSLSLKEWKATYGKSGFPSITMRTKNGVPVLSYYTADSGEKCFTRYAQ